MQHVRAYLLGRTGSVPVLRARREPRWLPTAVPQCRACTHDRRSTEAQERKLARSRAYHREHRDRLNAYAAKWRARNADRFEARCRAWYARNREIVKAKNAARFREQYALDPSPWRAAKAKRRAHKKRAGGTHTAADLRRQYVVQSGHCFWCDVGLGVRYHVDHLIPLSRPGTSNDPWNIVLACAPCNLSKNAKLPLDWAPRRWRRTRTS